MLASILRGVCCLQQCTLQWLESKRLLSAFASCEGTLGGMANARSLRCHEVMAGNPERASDFRGGKFVGRELNARPNMTAILSAQPEPLDYP